MRRTTSLRLALLVATALAAGPVFAAHAAAPLSSVEALSISAPRTEQAIPESSLKAIRQIGVVAAAAAGLAALVRIVGPDHLARLIRRAGAGAAKGVRNAISSPISAARAVGCAVGYRLRMLFFLGALTLLAMTGIGVFDFEWAGGLVVGAALVLIVWRGTVSTQRRFASEGTPRGPVEARAGD